MMRLLFMLLCLGITTTGSSTNAISAGVKSKQAHSFESFENSNFSNYFSPVATRPTNSLNNSISSAHGIPSYGTSYFEVVNGANDPKSIYSENSYKYITNSGVGSRSTGDEYSNLRQQASTDKDVVFRQGMYYGFTFMVILLNLVCFFLFDEKVFLHYCLALTGLTGVFLFSDGLFTMFAVDGIFNLKAFQSTLLLIAIGLSALFASRYLSLKEFYPKLKWFAIALYGSAIVSTLVAWVTADDVFANMANTLLFTMMAMYFLTGIMLFSRKNYAKFYVIAYAIPLLFAIDFFVLRNLGIDFLFTQSSHVKAAALVEMLVLTYAIMYRMQAIKEEHILRQTEMRIFLKRQEAILSRRKTEMMIEDVYLENLIMHYDLDGYEIKLLQYISEGKDNAKIARKLKTTEGDIEESTKDLYEKLEIGEHIKEDYRIVDSQPDYIYN